MTQETDDHYIKEWRWPSSDREDFAVAVYKDYEGKYVAEMTGDYHEGVYELTVKDMEIIIGILQEAKEFIGSLNERSSETSK